MGSAAWYQGGISVVDFTDSSNPVEIAFFDRGPIDGEDLIMGGYWSAYWYGGYIYATEIARGLDVIALTPSEYLTENEIAAASLRAADAVVNPQQQRRHVWPAEPVVARAYVDQLVRSDVLPTEQVEALAVTLNGAGELLDGGAGRDREMVIELEALAASLEPLGEGASEISRKRLEGLAETLEALAGRFR